MTFDKFHNRKMHLIFKEPPSFYSSTITRYLEVYDFELMLFVLNLTTLILKSKLTSIFHNYSSHDTNILAHVPARCLFSRANACEGYGLRILLL